MPENGGKRGKSRNDVQHNTPRGKNRRGGGKNGYLGAVASGLCADLATRKFGADNCETSQEQLHNVGR